MEHNQPHAVQHPAVYPLDNFVLHLAMGHMSPPDEHVGTFQHLPGQAVFRLAQGGGFYRKALFFQKRLNAPVDALWIYRRDFLKTAPRGDIRSIRLRESPCCFPPCFWF